MYFVAFSFENQRIDMFLDFFRMNVFVGSMKFNRLQVELEESITNTEVDFQFSWTYSRLLLIGAGLEIF